MEYQNVDMSWDLSIGIVVLVVYIVGKVWMYYRIDSRDTTERSSADTTRSSLRNPNKPKKGVIKRGSEWDV